MRSKEDLIKHIQIKRLEAQGEVKDLPAVVDSTRGYLRLGAVELQEILAAEFDAAGEVAVAPMSDTRREEVAVDLKVMREKLVVALQVPSDFMPPPVAPEMTSADRDQKVREMLLDGVDYGLIAGWIVDNARNALDMKFMVAGAMRGVQKLENL